MNLSQLRCFHAVAMANGFTAAAVALNISQPSISVQVKRLEAAYRVELFHRQGRRVELSQAGRRLLSITRKLFHFEDAAQLYLESAAEAVHGHVRIGGGSPHYVMPIIAELEKLHRGLTFSLEFGNTRNIRDAVYDNEIDVAVIPGIERFDERIDATVLVDDSLIALVPREHHLAGKEAVDLKSLLAERIILREGGSETRRSFERLLSEAGLHLGETQVIASREANIEAIACGLGVGVTRKLEAGKNPRLSRLRIECPQGIGGLLTTTEYIVCLKKRKSATVIRAFRKAAQAAWDPHVNITARPSDN